MMSIYRYLQPVNSLPQPDGPLSSSLPPVAIKEANKCVEAVYSTQKKQKRGTYDKLTPEQQLAMLHYTETRLLFVRRSLLTIPHF